MTRETTSVRPAHVEEEWLDVEPDAPQRSAATTFFRPTSAWQILLPVVTYLALSFAVISWVLLLVPVSGKVPLWSASPVLLAVVAAVGVYALVTRTIVTVDDDGFHFERVTGVRFVAFDDVREARVDGDALRLVLESGERLVLAANAPLGGASPDGRRALLADRILEGVRDHQEARARREAGAAALARGSRTMGEWLKALHAVGEGSGLHRRNAPPPDELRRLLVDPGASAELRVGAAVALRVAEGDASVEAIQVAARASAFPGALHEGGGADSDARVTLFGGRWP